MKRSRIIMAMAVFMLLWVTGCGKDETMAPMAKEYSATMVSKSAGQTITMQIYMKPDKFRTDTKMAGTSTIVRKDLKKVWTLMPAQKVYMEMEQMADAPSTQAVEDKVKGEVSRKKVGSETVNGHPSTKYEIITEADGKTVQIHQWWATDISFPVKTAAVDGSWSMEYTDIKIGDQPDSLFEIPAGYNKMTLPGGMPGGMSVKIPGMEVE